MDGLIINFRWIDIAVDDDDDFAYKYLVEIIDPDLGPLEVKYKLSANFWQAVSEQRIESIIWPTAYLLIIQKSLCNLIVVVLHVMLMLKFQQLSYFMADQNTAVEQVCTLGAIREETGPALSEDETKR